MKVKAHPSLIVGLDSPDDAGVYKLNNETALIQTLDFLTPVTDSPYEFGQIAAANSLSDVYAMGGRPITVMNIVCFPSCDLDEEILAETLRGGLDKIDESGAVLAGGHSVEDDEFKYGVSDRTASVRIPALVAKKGCGYLEDRRPASNCDPYRVATVIVEAVEDK